ncbi:AAA family ATPase [Actinoallomurus purpureus]|uniref:helix-turn-helix transcriptional regulator n=1 Tax=Actinoallomurus purpureus TaxID=478114 RepID=UPI00209256B6|nr:helix-turn-helix transcriptional regulator [Actinoallomurus purpureus]MCO6008336.1 AAA family ATPase [Actinoallomurus purpureus]
MLYGRSGEQQEISRLLDSARSGRSGALVVRGAPGIGKSVLLAHAANEASKMRVLRVRAVESESELPFAALQLLLRPVLGRVDRLPPTQADALRSALGLGTASVRDRFLVGFAVLTLLSDLGDDRPVLCLIDDAQWLDGASTDALAFAARRLEADAVAMIFAVRDDAPVLTGSGIPELRLGRLAPEAAEDLLTRQAHDLGPQVRQRILREAAGNPLALIELPNMLTPEQRSGRLGPFTFAVDGAPPSSRVQEAFQGQITGFAEAARSVLLVAAADDTGDLAVVLKAAELLGGTPADLEVVERAGLVHVSATTVAFRHPLIRAAAYQCAPYVRRVAAHRAIAAALEGPADADRRAWHLAAAATRPDDQVADAMEGVAHRAQERQGAAVASAAFERAAELTSDPRHAVRRLAAGAELAVHAGQFGRAMALADRALPLAGDPRSRVALDRVHASVEFERGSPGCAGRILVDGARRLSAVDVPGAARMLHQAGRNASFAGDAELAHAVAGGLRAIGMDTAARGMSTVASLLADEVLDDLGPVRDTAAILRTAPGDDLDQRLLAVSLSLMAGDEMAAIELGASAVAHCREHGMIGVLPQALALLAQAQMLRSRLDEAASAAAEALDIARDIGQAHRVAYLGGVVAWLSAIKGDDELCERLTRGADGTSEAGQVMAAWASGLLHLGRRRPSAALEWLAPIWHQGRRHQTVALYAAPELIEAAVRAGRADLAEEPMYRLDRWATAIGRPWSAAVVARCAALLAPDDRAEDHYAEAVRLYRHEVIPGQSFQHARAELLYGEWLRRRRRRAEARDRLRAAFDTFDRLGAVPWAERARAELRASGEDAVSAAPGPVGLLSPQESQVVRLAAAGLSNREIGAQLFLSPRTVGNHLYRAFPKLGVGSRSELSELDLSGLC